MSILVIYEDNHLLVVNKPAGVLSQGDRTGDLDLLTMGKAWVKDRYNKPGAVFLGLVHRLDRPASGVMLFARTSKAASRLAAQFKERSVQKVYLALVEGRTPGAGAWEDYLLKGDLAKSREDVRVVASGTAGAKEARLEMKTLHRFAASGNLPECSLIEIKLETGRTHQIRVQCSTRGFPLIGDFRYGSRTELDGKNLALHAARLELMHPTKKEQMSWSSPVPTTWPGHVRSWLSSDN